MNNTFRITISAVDKATAVVRHVKDSFSQVTRPVSDLTKSVVSLGRETGLDKVGKSILDIGNATSSLASKMAGVFPALGGGLGLAAIGAMAGRWADLGSEVGRTARNLDVSTQELQEFRAVARRADVAPEALDSSLKSLGSTMEDVFYHRASPEAITAMRQLGIEFHKTASGAPALGAALYDIADATKRLQGNPYAQRKLLDSLGISEDMLPMLRNGSQGIREFVAEYQKTHGMISADDIKRAEGFRESMIGLGDALSGVGYKIAANSAILIPYIDRITAFVAGHKSLLGMPAWSIAAGAAHMLPKAVASVSSFANADGLGNTVLGRLWDEDKAAFSRWWNGEDTKNVTPAANALPRIAEPAPPVLLPSFGSNPQGEPLGPQSPQRISSAGIPNPPPGSGIYINGPAPPPSVQAVGDAAAAMSPKISIELLLKNAPPGMQARARTPDGTEVPARVEYSMPTTVTP